MYEISTQKFSGPLDLLLQLVEKNNFEITEISLAKVTQDYLSYIENQALVASEELADFLVIAATLLLIKSKTLLPVLTMEPEEEEEILDLEYRLQLYKKYKEKGKEIQQLWQKRYFLFTRAPWKDVAVQFSPPLNFSVSNLAESFKKILAGFEEVKPLEEKKIARIVSLRERIQELIEKLTQGQNYNLKELVVKDANKDQKMDLIVTFLAVLYLAKENLIKIKQDKNFSSLWISSQK
ncbi:MAG: segregation/condensation protein A [Candidatus Pacebacteria bacterium]|jgi:segregation and condensation protein A|nr:segregation/condensation protein A [Candidatus Paceibacterota bacterium]MDD4994730.1 segregation/condensation protein A [Candidatus Paceibacterota bacterium]